LFEERQSCRPWRNVRAESLRGDERTYLFKIAAIIVTPAKENMQTRTILRFNGSLALRTRGIGARISQRSEEMLKTIWTIE
jgi:hypothetical protein